MIDGGLLYVYGRGLRNVARWYDDRHFNPSNKGTLEIYKIISRCSVTMILSSICNIVLILYDLWHFYGPNAKQNTEIYLSGFGMTFWSLIVVFNTLTYLWTIYFMFPWGQSKYDEICGFLNKCFDKRCCFCNKNMYHVLLKQHQLQYENGIRCQNPAKPNNHFNAKKIQINTCSNQNDKISLLN